MRGNDGKPVKNCHLLGTLKRVARLLYHNIRPVFVFDGAAPALKLKTIRARQQRRREADLDVERSARRILAAQMHRLLSSNTTTTAHVQKNRDEVTWEEKGGENEITPSSHQKRRNEDNSSPQVHVEGVVVLKDHLEEDDGSPDTSILPDVTSNGNTSTQHDGDRNVNDGEIQWQSGNADEMGEGGEESIDDEDAIILPEEDGIDMSVVAALPIHMRKKVIEKAQRNERMRSRRMYMPLAGDAERFCNAQIQNLIRGSELNRKIKNLQEVQREKVVVSSAGEGAAERSIASDETRKFIITTESPNVQGSSTQAMVEGRLGTYEGFEEWDYKSSDGDEGEEDDDVKYGDGGFVVDAKVGHMERNESRITMKIECEEKPLTHGKSKSVRTMKTEYDDDGAVRAFLSNTGDAAVSDSHRPIKRTGAVLEYKNSKARYNFNVNRNSTHDVVVNENIQASSSSTIHKMGGNSESGVVHRSMMIPTNVEDGDVQNSQERQQDTQQQQYQPSQWNDAVEDEFGFKSDNHFHLSHATPTDGDCNGTIGFRILQQEEEEEEEEDHGTAAATADAATLHPQRELTRSGNETPTNEEAAAAHRNEEMLIRDVDLEINPEDISYADMHPPSSFYPVSDLNDGSRVDKAIEQSSDILGNMPDYVKRQFQRHVKEYYRKEKVVPQSSMDNDDHHSDEKIHGSSSGGIILKEDDEWEDGMMNNQEEGGGGE